MALRAFWVQQEGDAISAEVTQVEDEVLGADPVLIAIEWSSLNFKDSMVLRPHNRVARRSPLIPGVDLAGTVMEGCDGIEAGTAVLVQGYDLGVAHHGGFAERARVPANWVVPLPKELTTRHGALIGTAGFTAALSLQRLESNGLIPSNGPVLVTGASGGVGSMAVSLLAQRGYEVVASTGKHDEHRYLRALGAAAVIGRDELQSEPGRVLGAPQWAAAVDCVGGTTLASLIRSIRYGGAVAASGLTAGTDLLTTVYPFIVRGVALLGIDSVLTPIEERRGVWARVASDFVTADLEAMVADEIGLGDLEGALGSLSAGRVRGRVLVEPSR